MAGRSTKSNPPPAIEREPSGESLASTPSPSQTTKASLSNESARPHAALLAQGSDPYAEETESTPAEDPVIQLAAEIETPRATASSRAALESPPAHLEAISSSAILRRVANYERWPP